MPRPANAKPAVDPSARRVLTLEPCQDFATLCTFYRDQFPGFAGHLITAAIERIAASHSFLTIRDEVTLIGAIGAISYDSRPATELFLECSKLPGIGIHKILAALETIWAFNTSDTLAFCFSVADENSVSARNYGDLGFSKVDVRDPCLPLEEREALLGVPIQRNAVMLLKRADVDRPVQWLRSRFHSGRFLTSSPGMPTFKLEDTSLRIPLFRSVAGMKSSLAMPPDEDAGA